MPKMRVIHSVLPSPETSRTTAAVRRATHCRLFHNWSRWSKPRPTGSEVTLGAYYQERFCKRCAMAQRRGV